MDKARERAKAAMAAKREHDSSKTKRVAARRARTQPHEQAPAREVIVGGRAISLPGLRFLDE
jgi:hypothetical protein